MQDKYLYEVKWLATLSTDELKQLLAEHGYDLTDLEWENSFDPELAIEVLSNLVEC